MSCAPSDTGAGPRIRLCLLIRQLSEGGAERQLVDLVEGLHALGRFECTIITFYSGGWFSQQVALPAGVTLVSLDKRGRWDVFGFLWRLVRTVRRVRPHILHGYLDTSNLLVSLLRPFYPRARTVWGVRASSQDWRRYGSLSRFIFFSERMLSRFADLIIVNSNAGRDYHVAQGFPAGKMMVIHNGINTRLFSPDPRGRERLRAEWGATGNHKVIGLVGRLDPVKGVEVFLGAASALARERDDVRFVCVGSGPGEYAGGLRALSAQLGLAGRLVWTGPRRDMAAVYSALDVITSTSTTEGFANVIAEAMACGVPAVVTSVGDSRLIVGDLGIVVSPGATAELVSAWQAMLARIAGEGSALGQKTRARIHRLFSLERLVAETAQALEALVAGPRATRRARVTPE